MINNQLQLSSIKTTKILACRGSAGYAWLLSFLTGKVEAGEAPGRRYVREFREGTELQWREPAFSMTR